MITMKQYLAESRLPESALRPLYREDSDVAHNTSSLPDDDQAWRAEFGAVYQNHYWVSAMGIWTWWLTKTLLGSKEIGQFIYTFVFFLFHSCSCLPFSMSSDSLIEFSRSSCKLIDSSHHLWVWKLSSFFHPFLGWIMKTFGVVSSNDWCSWFAVSVFRSHLGLLNLKQFTRLYHFSCLGLCYEKVRFIKKRWGLSNRMNSAKVESNLTGPFYIR